MKLELNQIKEKKIEGKKIWNDITFMAANYYPDQMAFKTITKY